MSDKDLTQFSDLISSHRRGPRLNTLIMPDNDYKIEQKKLPVNFVDGAIIYTMESSLKVTNKKA